MLSYAKLWVLLESKGMKKTDLTKNKVISPATLAKLGKNEPISSTVIEKVCEFLNCQPGDMMEYVSDEQIKSIVEQIDNINKTILEQFKAQGVSEEQYTAMMCQVIPDMIKGLQSGRNPLTEMFEQAIAERDAKK